MKIFAMSVLLVSIALSCFGATNSVPEMVLSPRGSAARTAVLTEAVALLGSTNAISESARSAELKAAWNKCENLQWGGRDIVSGCAVVTMARIRMAEGNYTNAIGIIKENLPYIYSIHEKAGGGDDSESAYLLASARYWLAEAQYTNGVLLFCSGRKREGLREQAEAVQHFCNCFARWPGSKWATDAAEKYEAILETFPARHEPSNDWQMIKEALAQSKARGETNSLAGETNSTVVNGDARQETSHKDIR